MSDNKTETGQFTTTVRTDQELYTRLRQKLIGQGITFTDWIDKMVRRELGLSPKFSYGKDKPSGQTD